MPMLPTHYSRSMLIGGAIDGYRVFSEALFRLRQPHLNRSSAKTAAPIYLDKHCNESVPVFLQAVEL